MNAFQKFSRYLTEGRGEPPGIAPPKRFEPPMPRPEDWLSRLGEIARRGGAGKAPGPCPRLERWARSIDRET